MTEPTAFFTKGEAKSSWCLDSGCTTHLCRDKKSFTEITSIDVKRVNLADDASTNTTATGTVSIMISNNADDELINLKNVLHVPTLRTNLMLVAKITDKGNKVTFYKDKAIVFGRNGGIRLVAVRKGDLYFIRNLEEHVNNVSVVNKSSKLKLWHDRLGHLNTKDVIEMDNRNIIPKVENIALDCSICLQGKLTALSFPQRLSGSTHKLEIIHSDLCGPMRTESQGKSKYFVTFIDDYSRWCEVRFLTKKSDLLNAFKEFKNLVGKQTGAKVKSLQSDNGKEYCNKEFDAYLKEHGIKRRLTVPYTPQQNGVAERKNRTLVEMARCMILQSGVAPSFWAEAIATANFLRNRCTTKALNGSIPYEAWTGSRVRLNFLQTFGCKVYALDKSPSKDKFAPRGKEGIFVDTQMKQKVLEYG